MKDPRRPMVRWLAPMFICLISVLASIPGNSGATEKPTDRVTDEPSPSEATCPPDGSRIALFSRQAFDEGRGAEGHEYGKLNRELLQIAISSPYDGEIIKKSIAASEMFVKTMAERGHDLRVGDIVIDREVHLKDALRLMHSMGSMLRARYELELLIVRGMKRAVCGR